MSTHSAECSPHTCLMIETMGRASSMNAARGWTLIRKTSLLRKINPMMRRSSFTNKEHLKPDHLAMNEHQTFQEIVIGIKRITSRDPNSDQSPLYDVRNHARVSRRTRHAKRCFADDYLEATYLGNQTIWWSQTGSNRRPHACKARALPAELWPRNQKTNAHSMKMVGLGRLELPTSRLSSARSNQLSYKPLTHILRRTRDPARAQPATNANCNR